MKRIVIISSLITIVAFVWATQMIVHTTSGDEAFELSEITSITFGNGGDFEWTIKAAMPTVRSSGGSAVVGNTIYTINGHEGNPGTGRIVEAYDVLSDSWSTKATYPRPEGRYGQGVAVIDEDIYVFCGTNSWGTYFTNTVDKYNETSDWTLDVSTYPLSEISSCMCAAVNGYIYCFGGADSYSASTITNNVYQFDPSNGSFTQKSDMPTARAAGMAIPFGDKIYVIGGVYGTVFDIVEIYDTTNDSWSTGSSVPVDIMSFVGGVINGKIYIASGSSGGWSITNSVFEYDPYQDTWSEKEPINYERTVAFGGVVNSKFYIIGGHDESGSMPGAGVNFTEEGTIVP
jgi:N-acetylneuraminic acid mutarotase